MKLHALYTYLSCTLRGRLIVSVAAVHAVMMTLFLTDLTLRQRALLLDRQTEEAYALSQALAVSSAGWLAARDVSGLQELVDSQRRYPELLFAFLTDEQGRILAATDSSKLGLYLRDLPPEARQTLYTKTKTLVDVATPALLTDRPVGWVRVGVGQKLAGQKLAALTRSGLLYALAAIVIGSLIAWVMGCRITRRIHAIQETIDKVRAGKNTTRAHVAGDDEAAKMAQEFNVMLDTLEEQDAKLRESEERLRMTLEATRIGIWDWDAENSRWYASPTYYTTLGYEPRNESGNRHELLDWVHPDDRAMVAQKIEDVLTLDFTEYEYEARFLHADGLYRWQYTRGFRIQRNRTGKTSRLLGIRMDIDARKQIESQLMLLDFALNHVKEAAYLADEDGRFHYVNQEACNALGYTVDEMLTMSVADVDIDSPLTRWPDQWRKLKAQGSLQFECHHKTKDGRILPVELSANYFEYDGRGYNLALARNITDRQKSEMELHRLNRELRAISICNQALLRAENEQSLLQEICRIIVDEAGYSLAWVGIPEHDEARTVRPVAWAGQELSYLNGLTISWAENSPLGQGPSGRAIRSGEVISVQDIEADSRLAPWHERLQKYGYRSCTAVPIKDETGTAFGVLHAYSTEAHISTPDEIRLLGELADDLAFGLIALRTRAEGKRAEAEVRKLSSAVEQSPASIVITDTTGNIEYVNPRFTQVTGYTREEAIGKNPRLLKSGEATPEAYRQMWDTITHGGVWHGEFHNKKKNGELYWEYASISPVTDAQGVTKHFVAVKEDITERKQVMEALHQSEAKLRNILENVGIGVALISPRLEVLDLNRRMREWFPEIKTSKRPLCYCSFNNPPRQAPCTYCPTLKTLKDGRVYEATTSTPRGGTLRNYHIISSPICDEKGEITAVIEIVEDITDRLSLENQLQQSQKMEAVGRLAGGVAHDFNNMLTVILGCADLALGTAGPAHPLAEHLAEIRKTALRSADLVRQLLAFARKQTVTPQVLDLNEVMAGMLKMLRRLIGEDIDLTWRPGAALWPIKMDPSQLDQILANLCVNARDAMEGTGEIVIETSNAHIDAHFCVDHADGTPGDYVVLAVSDTGHGMDKQVLAHIFEPFFTTKEPGKGTGLGLATVYGIVKQNGGFIVVTSEPRHGASFKLHLPRHASTENDQPAATPAEISPQGHETILMVEDDPTILAIAARMVSQYGYRVLTAATPEDGLRIAQEHSQEIQLLITDVIMPQMNGQELARRIKALCPSIKQLFMSGYTGDIIAQHGALKKDVHFIQKPFSMQNLAASIRKALDGPA